MNGGMIRTIYQDTTMTKSCSTKSKPAKETRISMSGKTYMLIRYSEAHGLKNPTKIESKETMTLNSQKQPKSYGY